jgi:hypothetical protein
LATGVPAPSFLSLDEIGVQDLFDANLPDPTDNAGALAAFGVVGTPGTLADPRPEAFAKTGLLAPTHDLVWLNHIHILPRLRELGSVVSAHQFEVEVWNAFMRTSQTLDEITVEGPAGITVIDHLGQPAHYPASDSQVYTVEVSAEGDPQIDNLITWVFVGIDSTGSTVTVLGFRLIPFPFPPNMALPITETFGYQTDIVRSFAGDEQRIQLRVVPVGTISYSLYLSEVRDAQMLNAIIFGNQPRAFGVGRWQFRTPLATAAAADDLSIYCTTDDIPFIAGGLVMLWTSPYEWEVQTIASVESDHLVLTSGLRSAWAAGTAVLPAVIARMSQEEGLSWESLLAVSQKITFDVDGFTP